MLSAPLMMGGDLRSMNEFCEKLMLNKELLAINQDEEARPPYVVQLGDLNVENPNPKDGEFPWVVQEQTALTMIKHLSGGEFAIGLFNLSKSDAQISCIFADCGLPYTSGYGFEMTDVFTGEKLGVVRDYYCPVIPGHDCRVFRCKLVKC